MKKLVALFMMTAVVTTAAQSFAAAPQTLWQQSKQKVSGCRG